LYRDRIFVPDPKVSPASSVEKLGEKTAKKKLPEVISYAAIAISNQ
jgi:hypothetical protein